ncbi:MAG TPA: hypothetical protein DF712_02680 [Balneola sp.]|nr:hypothetical protein [Balneola sp.]
MEQIIHISIHLFKQQRKQTQQMQKETVYECFGIRFAEITSLKEEGSTYVMNPEKGEDILKRKDLSGKNVIIHDHPEIVGLLACDPKISIFYIKNEKIKEYTFPDHLRTSGAVWG